jgi:hypothetical protein
MRTIRSLGFMATVVVVGALVPAATIGGDLQPSAVSRLRVSLDCSSTPERVTIKNNRGGAIKILKIGSTYRPRNGEPFYVGKRLAPGRRVTYTFGRGRGPNRLTRQFIFTNSASTEGVRVRTNKGTITKRC